MDLGSSSGVTGEMKEGARGLLAAVLRGPVDQVFIGQKFCTQAIFLRTGGRGASAGRGVRGESSAQMGSHLNEDGFPSKRRWGPI